MVIIYEVLFLALYADYFMFCDSMGPGDTIAQ